MNNSTTPAFFPINRRLRAFGIALIVIASVLIYSTVSVGEQPDQNKSYAKWVTSYEQAVEQSNETGRPIMLVFTGSDWCNWCTRLADEVFMTHEFARWSTDNVIKVEVNFPQTYDLPAEIASQNAELKTLFGHHVNAYPTVLFVKPDGKLIGKTGYVAGGAEPWIKSAEGVLPSHAADSDLLAQSN